MGSVHQGFAQVLTETNIASSVKNCLKTMQQPNRILLTGHSLGAALATLMSTLLPSAQLFTFGSPRVGDAAFAQAVKTIAHWRYIDCCDSVTRVPPTVLGYVHVGTRQYFDKDGQWLDNASEDAIKADRLNGIDAYRAQQGFFHGTLFPRELADHAPINYVSAVMGLRPAPCPNHER